MSILSQYERTITVKTRTADGVDDFNHPKYTWASTEVEGVLIQPHVSEDEDTSSVRQDGHKIVYTLYIPIGCELDFENAKVIIDNKEYDVIGAPQPYPAVPEKLNRFNQVVKVGKSNG